MDGFQFHNLSNLLALFSVPCTPSNLESQVGAEVVNISWSASIGAVNYTSVITGDGEVTYECHTPHTSCSVPDLMCGSQYSMAVTAYGQYCNSNRSYTKTFQTAPCSPQNVTAEVDCVTNIVAVSWDKSLGADNYTALAITTDGGLYVCHSNSTYCDIVGLSCGQKSVITVSAANNYSDSKASSAIELLTAPCTPTNLISLAGAEVVDVSWLGSIGAVNYTTLIIKDGGDKYECHTSNMSCSVTDLMCGSQYSVTVTANGAYCSSNSSHTHSFQTGHSGFLPHFKDIQIENNL
ncbi:fibronectin type III domain-containing protein 7-like [Ranitomeya imitator]|uniref:fibronectin type III domain-containing protein 7-like n=1 Tax=Ranitomeya imitator TaxID=111125 RepID=UPI0037E965B5